MPIAAAVHSVEHTHKRRGMQDARSKTLACLPSAACRELSCYTRCPWCNHGTQSTRLTTGRQIVSLRFWRRRAQLLKRRLPVSATGKVDLPGVEVHVEDLLGRWRRAELGCKRVGQDIERVAQQLDGRAGVDELAHQVAHTKAAFVAHLRGAEAVEGVLVSAFHIHARHRLQLARPRLSARQKVRLARAITKPLREANDVQWQRDERQDAVLHRCNRRDGSNLLWQVRLEVGIEVCGGLAAREGAHAQKLVHRTVIQIAHRKLVAEHDDAVAEPPVLSDMLEHHARILDERAVGRPGDLEHKRRPPTLLATRIGSCLEVVIEVPVLERLRGGLRGGVKRFLTRFVLLERRP
eukprot:scaffold2548_cov121-Isochrysis_galbana.AAC.2